MINVSTLIGKSLKHFYMVYYLLYNYTLWIYLPTREQTLTNLTVRKEGIWSVRVCLVEWLQNVQNILNWLPWLLGSYYYIFSKNIVKYGFILFFVADRYFTPLPLKSFNVYGGYRGNGPAPSDDFETFGQLVHSDDILTWREHFESQMVHSDVFWDLCSTTLGDLIVLPTPSFLLNIWTF